jgi:diguanylate cyclase (GGDEF)-like protein
MVHSVITVRRLVSLLAPGALLLSAALALQQQESVWQAAVPYAAFLCFGSLAAAALLSWYHNYSRVLCAALVVGLTVWGFGRMATVADVTRLAAAFLLPLNFILFAILKERGLTTFNGLIKLGLIGVQVAALLRLTQSGGDRLNSFFQLSEHASTWTWMPSSAVLLFAMTGLSLIILIFFRQTNVEAGLLWALAAVFVGLNQAGEQGALYFYCGGAGMVLVFSVLEHGFDLAYRDELTGLPGRRAFNEVLRQLRRRYTIAMCDVDHFKEFNDTYGHDVGDQVLKIVASRLLNIRGGGRAFRYGGEEFAVIFNGKSATEVQPFVDAVREAIAAMDLSLDLPEGTAEKASRKSGTPEPIHSVTITISVGLADHSSRSDTPEVVLEAADAALYRAKESGRNCVELAENFSS